MAALLLDISIFSIAFFCFSILPVPWSNLGCCYWYWVAPFILGYILFPRLRRVLPTAEEGFFWDWAPRPNVDIDMSFPVFYPPHYHIVDSRDPLWIRSLLTKTNNLVSIPSKRTLCVLFPVFRDIILFIHDLKKLLFPSLSIELCMFNNPILLNFCCKLDLQVLACLN